MECEKTKKRRSSVVPLTELPFDCFFEISNYFATQNEVMNIMLTCKLLSDFFSSSSFRGCRNVDFVLQTREFVYNKPDGRSLYWFVSSVVLRREHEWVKRKLKRRICTVLLDYVKSFPNLRKLEIEEHVHDPTSLPPVLKECPNLVEISAKEWELLVDQSIPVMQYLEVLVVCCLRITRSDCAKVFPALRTFVVFGGSRDVKCVSQNTCFPRLKELSLFKSFDVESHTSLCCERPLFELCKNIEELRIFSSVNVERVKIPDLDFFSNLNELCLRVHGEFIPIEKLSMLKRLKRFGIVINERWIFPSHDRVVSYCKSLFQLDFIHGLMILDVDIHDGKTKFLFCNSRENSPRTDVQEFFVLFTKLIQAHCSASTKIRICCKNFITKDDTLELDVCRSASRDRLNEDVTTIKVLCCENCATCKFCRNDLSQMTSLVSQITSDTCSSCTDCRRQVCRSCSDDNMFIFCDESISSSVDFCKECFPPKSCTKCGDNSMKSHLRCVVCKKSVCCDVCKGTVFSSFGGENSNCVRWCRDCEWTVSSDVCCNCFKKYLKLVCEFAEDCGKEGCIICRTKCPKCSKLFCGSEKYEFDVFENAFRYLPLCIGRCDKCRVFKVGEEKEMFCIDCFPSVHTCPHDKKLTL